MPRSRTALLPDFGRPPINEVVLSVQFEPLDPLLTHHLGMFWETIRERYPRAEVHPPIESAFERLGSPVVRPPGIQIEFAQPPLFPRLWLLNQTGTELIQVQQDRFVHNWRKIVGDEPYPRYEHIREQFKSELVAFADFTRSHGFGDVKPNQCEVTYINHIESDASSGKHGDPADVLSLLSRGTKGPSMHQPESLQMSAKYLIESTDHSESRVVGRLHVDFLPVFTVKESRPIFALNLIARGVPLSEGIEGAMDFLDLGRVTIVRSFADMTTSSMHKIWDRKDA